MNENVLDIDDALINVRPDSLNDKTQEPNVLNGISLKNLLLKYFPQKQWIIPGLLSPGLIILAGPPKVGKSWLALALCTSVASGLPFLGKFNVERGTVNYLALEDTDERLQNRLITMDAPMDSDLYLCFKCPSGEEGLLTLDEHLQKNPNIRMVVIDTLAKFKGESLSKGGYNAEYGVMGKIKEIADKHHCTIVVIHHTKKVKCTDIMNSLYGSNGLNGAADATLILNRGRGELTGSLYITGRDVNEEVLPLVFDPDNGSWSINAEIEEEARMSPERTEILDLLREARLKPIDIAIKLNKNRSTTRVLVMKMKEDGVIDVDPDGFYFAVDPEEIVNSPHDVNSINDSDSAA